jgi:hypothetical protein
MTRQVILEVGAGGGSGEYIGCRETKTEIPGEMIQPIKGVTKRCSS